MDENAKRPDVLPQVRENLLLLNRHLAENADLKAQIIDLLEAYLTDDAWPSNLRELERCLELLITGLSGMIRNCLINSMALFEAHPEILPSHLKAFLKEIQGRYAYKFRTGVYRTILSYEGFNWYSVNIQGFNKYNQSWYAINLTRNDGNTFYFEGSYESLNKLIDIIKGTMLRDGKVDDSTEFREE